MFLSVKLPSVRLWVRKRGCFFTVIPRGEKKERFYACTTLWRHNVSLIGRFTYVLEDNWTSLLFSVICWLQLLRESMHLHFPNLRTIKSAALLKTCLPLADQTVCVVHKLFPRIQTYQKYKPHNLFRWDIITAVMLVPASLSIDLCITKSCAQSLHSLRMFWDTWSRTLVCTGNIWY